MSGDENARDCSACIKAGQHRLHGKDSVIERGVAARHGAAIHEQQMLILALSRFLGVGDNEEFIEAAIDIFLAFETVNSGPVKECNLRFFDYLDIELIKRGLDARLSATDEDWAKPRLKRALSWINGEWGRGK